jgi:hypothetical protein
MSPLSVKLILQYGDIRYINISLTLRELILKIF